MLRPGLRSRLRSRGRARGLLHSFTCPFLHFSFPPICRKCTVVPLARGRIRAFLMLVTSSLCLRDAHPCPGGSDQVIRKTRETPKRNRGTETFRTLDITLSKFEESA